jgi:hypothetical protein
LKKGKVEIDEIDLEFCLIHVFYKVLPCGYTYLMGVYKIERKHNRVNKMIILGLNKFFFSKFINLLWAKHGKMSDIFRLL